MSSLLASVQGCGEKTHACARGSDTDLPSLGGVKGGATSGNAVLGKEAMEKHNQLNVTEIFPFGIVFVSLLFTGCIPCLGEIKKRSNE